MAGSQKEFELLFKLKASLGGSFNSTFKNAINTNNQLRDSLKNVNSLQSKIDGYTKQSAAIDKNKERLAQLNAEHDRLQQELQQTSEPTEALRRKLEKNESQIQQTTARIREQEQQLDTYGQELREAGINTDNLEEANGRLQRSYERLQSSQQTLQQINQRQQQVQQSISQTKGQLMGTIGVISAVATAVYAGPVKSAMALQQEMQNVGTLLDGDVTSKLSALSNEVVKLSTNTGIGTSDLTDGLYQVISAFGETTESIQQLEVAAKAAKAGGATTTDAINLLSAVTKGYGDTSAEAQQKAADLAFQTVKLGQTDFPSLASSIGKVIPLAATLGTTQEDLFGAMATLTGVTGGTAEVTTQLKATMQGFLSPSTNMTKALQSMGYESGKALLESKGLQGALEALKDSVGGDELAFAKLFSSVEAQTAVLALAGTQADNFTEKTKQMYEATGAAQQAYETATNSTEAKMQKAKNSITNLGIVLGQNLLPIVGNLADKVASLVTKVSEFAQENPKAVQTVLKLVAGLAGLKVAGLGTKLGFLEAKKGILGIMGAFEKFKALKAAESLGGVATKAGGIAVKLGPIVAVAAAIGAAIYYVANNLEDVRAKIQQTFGDEGLKIFDQIWASITMVGDAFKTAFAGVSTDVFSTLQQILPTIISTLQTAATSILPVLVQVINALLPLFQTIISAILPVLTTLINALVPVIQVLASVLSSVLGGALTTITNIVKSVMTVFQGLIDFITGVFTGNWSQAWNGIKSIFSGAVSGLGEIIKAPLRAVVSVVNGVISGLNKLKVPDWVPGIGGKGINIPLIPGFAKGTLSTPDTFIAGEKGPELITNAPGRTVFTADQTRNILAAQNTAATTAAIVAQTAPAAQTVNGNNTAPEVAAGAGNGGGAKNVTINNNPTIVINGDKPEDLEAKLEENNRKLLRDVEDLLDEKEDKERRQKYD